MQKQEDLDAWNARLAPDAAPDDWWVDGLRPAARRTAAAWASALDAPVSDDDDEPPAGWRESTLEELELLAAPQLVDG